MEKLFEVVKNFLTTQFNAELVEYDDDDDECEEGEIQ